MTHRGTVILLHWLLAFLVLAMIKGGSAAEWLRWMFVGASVVWLGLTFAKGMLAKPGPKLPPLARQTFPWMHRAMYLLIAAAAILNALALFGIVPLVAAWNALLVLFVASIFHAIFHLWRHTTLIDGALRMMTPKIWHKYL